MVQRGEQDTRWSVASGHWCGKEHRRTTIRGMEYRSPRSLRSRHAVSGEEHTKKKVTHRSRNRLCHPFCEELEFLIEHLPPFPFLLLHLDLIFITIAMLSLPIASLVKLYVRSFAEELNVLAVARINESCVMRTEVTAYMCLSLSYHNRGLQMNVNDHK